MSGRNYTVLWPVRHAAHNCVVALLDGKPDDAFVFRMQFLRFANALRAEGVEVGSMLEEAWGGYEPPPMPVTTA